MESKSIWLIGVIGVVLLALVLGAYGYFIRPEATEAYSQFPTSGVFITAVIGITLVTLTLLVMQTWIAVSAQQRLEQVPGPTVLEQIENYFNHKLTKKIGEIQKSYEQLIKDENKALEEKIEAQLFPRHKARIDYLLKLQDGHRKTIEEHNEKGKVIKTTKGPAKIDLQEKILELLEPSTDELDLKIQQLEGLLKAVQSNLAVASKVQTEQPDTEPSHRK